MERRRQGEKEEWLSRSHRLPIPTVPLFRPVVARMERSVIRDPLSQPQPRISLRSIRATGPRYASPEYLLISDSQKKNSRYS